MGSKLSFCQAKRDLLKPTCTLVGVGARSVLAGGSGESSGEVEVSCGIRCLLTRQCIPILGVYSQTGL